jgi:hypothetical protein
MVLLANWGECTERRRVQARLTAAWIKPIRSHSSSARRAKAGSVLAVLASFLTRQSLALIPVGGPDAGLG